MIAEQVQMKDKADIKRDISVASGNPDMMFADDLDDAIIGYTTRDSVVYAIDKIIRILMDSGMDYDDAIDHFYYNIDGSHVGKYTPIYIHTPYHVCKKMRKL